MTMMMIKPGDHNKNYHRYLIDFMSFKLGVEHDKNETFCEEELNGIVPDDIKRWMQSRVFGVPDGGVVEEGTEFLIRSST